MITRYFSFTMPIKHMPDGRRYMRYATLGFLFEAYPHGDTYFWSIKQLKDHENTKLIIPAYKRTSLLLSHGVFEVVQMGENPDFDWIYNTFRLFLESHK